MTPGCCSAEPPHWLRRWCTRPKCKRLGGCAAVAVVSGEYGAFTVPRAAACARRLARAQVGLAAALARPDKGRPPMAFGWLAPAARGRRQEAIEARAAMSAALAGAASSSFAPAGQSPVVPAEPLILTDRAGQPLRPAGASEPVLSASAAELGSPSVAGRRTAVAVAVIVACAVAGLLLWPLTAVAVSGAAVLARSRRGGRLVLSAVAVAAFTGYCGFAILLTSMFGGL